MGANCGKNKPLHDPAADTATRKLSASKSVKTSPSSGPSQNGQVGDDDEDPGPVVQRRTTRRNTGRANFVVHNSSDITHEFEVGDKAGEGTQGVVFRAKRKKTGVMRAIKQVPKKKVDPEKFKTEIELMKRMDHPNIIKLFETFEDRTSTYLVLELCGGGELFDKIVAQGSLSEVEAAFVMQNILRAVHYMHEKDVAHRDLKPENFLFCTKGPIDEDNLLKLIDFGIACECKPGTILKEVVGTPFYVAPQVISKKYDKMCDLWSCGVIMYALLSGSVPFNGNSDSEVLQKVREGIVRYGSEWSPLSDDAKSLVKRLLTRSPKDRCTAQEALEHDWIEFHAPRATSKLQDGIVNSLRNFRRKNRLKQAALTIVANEIDDEQIRHLRETFTALDSNGDGLLTYSEIAAAALDAGLEVPPELEELFADSRDAVIDYSEFLAATLDVRNHLSDEAVRVAFGMFDVDGDGRVAAKDIAKIFGDLHKSDRDSESLGIISKYEKEGAGALDLEDFTRMLRSARSPEAQGSGDRAQDAPVLADRFSLLNDGTLDSTTGAGSESKSM
mmetsp:Transcript_144708/g.360733  ORF Transcript_144708/g.360733 Transcript_144708/m.360733 type:complete len:558 (-) Transcript_144708:273-1946(-)|eukprot:CAMPEP_0115453792 /NCGR_PEP_ID=MMETSP0271-20121206/43297_1 /TAXON_ID=71861 /ORGANISM="Scrippsiella trochoidea, Strain CCMP3099" /LENGTH=557 /DNA_ID=CAMNT_0002880171 /DNA_START=50 /DNA_END=1723 /DNA_ORIENTATION=+